MQRFGWDKKNAALVFRVNGNVPVRISWTFAIPIVLPFLREWSNRPGNALIHTSIFAVLFFVSVFLHELAHVWAARRQGIGTDRVDLYLFGGVAYFKRGVASSHSWAWIAFAGPLANMVLAVRFHCLPLSACQAILACRGGYSLQFATSKVGRSSGVDALGWRFVECGAVYPEHSPGLSPRWEHDRAASAYRALRRQSGGSDRRLLWRDPLDLAFCHHPACRHRRCPVMASAVVQAELASLSRHQQEKLQSAAPGGRGHRRRGVARQGWVAHQQITPVPGSYRPALRRLGAEADAPCFFFAARRFSLTLAACLLLPAQDISFQAAPRSR